MSLWPLALALTAVVLALIGGSELFRGGSGQRGADVDRRALSAGPSGRRRGGAGTLRLVGASAGVMLGFPPSQLLPGRLGPLVLAAAVLAGFLLPDLLRARSARIRHRRMIVALPDALDLLAVSVASGRGLGGSLTDLARSGRGPLIEELARVGEDIAWGSGQARALDALRRRVGGPEMAALVATLERSRRLGSPLADLLRRQSATLRQDQRRAIEEEAARAAPKIQLVIALILVPSVLLLMVAALIANADTVLPTGI
ncbi:MAG: type II secretion system F family protein [Solirubrobacterales bacterium]|nr:type II secretion system F family protein [Solirubrobacterales bacterium]